MRSGASPGTGIGRRTVAAFTLVELLVVIGIIALLISVLLPALNKARQSASMTACKANLKSIGQAVMIYATANKGSLPIGQYDPRTFGLPVGDGGTNWVVLLQNALDPKYGTTWNEADATSANTTKLRDLFLCPDGPIENEKSVGASAITHFASHPYLIPHFSPSSWSLTSPPAPRKPYKISQIRSAAEKLLISDASLYFDSVNYNPPIWHHYQEMPILGLIDNNQIQLGDQGMKLFTNWRTAPENGSPRINLDDSIRMKPSNGSTITASDVNADTLANANNVRFRHMRDTAANVLMADGHVENFTINMRLAKTKPSDPKITTLKKRNVFINYIP